MGQYVLPDLDYDYGDLEPAIIGEINELHHGKHHAAYVKGANDTLEQIEEIISIQLHRLESLLAERKLSIELTPEARHALAEEGYDPAFGARPLKRAIQRLIQNPLALAVLEGKFGEGDRVLVTRDPNGELEFTRAEPVLTGAGEAR